jgi:mutator protein MutT
MMPIPVVAGILRGDDGRILFARRHLHSRHGGLWEFPGGKIETGETPPEALARELLEELGVEVAVGAELLRVEHAYPHATVELIALECTLVRGTPEPVDCWQVEWVRREDLLSFPMPEADLPIARLLAGG